MLSDNVQQHSWMRGWESQHNGVRTEPLQLCSFTGSETRLRESVWDTAGIEAITKRASKHCRGLSLQLLITRSQLFITSLT